ncbi:hypothetical protein AMTR_s00004p00219280 [Amborella trichopoda]|uniref:Uncharacterized protein n=1 Tax=Amborella trichopoda TaxID=13333 RepID=W1NE96_AMBTC|nr:hypothetical protein AMTR_s00004p00219280 [Amborella trichopoda]
MYMYLPLSSISILVFASPIVGCRGFAGQRGFGVGCRAVGFEGQREGLQCSEGLEWVEKLWVLKGSEGLEWVSKLWILKGSEGLQWVAVQRLGLDLRELQSRGCG